MYPTVALKIKNLVSTWGGENSFILFDINMDVKKGSLIGILGPVGCGKSSIIMSIIQVHLQLFFILSKFLRSVLFSCLFEPKMIVYLFLSER